MATEIQTTGCFSGNVLIQAGKLRVGYLNNNTFKRIFEII